jgi:hypothetical protein
MAKGRKTSGPLKRVSVSTRAKSYNVRAEAVWVGPDLLVAIRGGDRPHIGAVAAAQPRPSLRDASKTSATASVLTYVGHKEDSLAKDTAERLASILETNVVVTAGIHWDNLDDQAIQTILNNCRDLVAKLISKLTGM